MPSDAYKAGTEIPDFMLAHLIRSARRSAWAASKRTSATTP